MKTRTASWLIAVPALIFNTSEIYPGQPAIFQGSVVHGVPGKGVENTGIAGNIGDRTSAV